jgi:fructokinase
LQIVSIGELLWDVFDQEELLGGAPVNFSAASHKLGTSVTLITAVGEDVRGTRAIERMRALGLSTEFVRIVPDRPTGTALVSTDKSGNANFVIVRPAAFDSLEIDDFVRSLAQGLRPDWIYFGTLAQTSEQNEDKLNRLIRSSPGSKCFYDMNLRDGHWNLPLVQRLSVMASALKLNESEAETLFQLTWKSEGFSLQRFCQHWSAAYGIGTICVTLGSKGCATYKNDTFQKFPGFPIRVADTVGAGDAFAAAFLHGLQLDWSAERTASFANAVGAIVASRAGATPAWTPDECLQMIDHARTAGDRP